MRTLGLQDVLLLLVAYGSAAVTFMFRQLRLLWASMLAAACGFCEGRFGTTTSEANPEGPASGAWLLVLWLLILLPPAVLGAGFAARRDGWSGLTAAFLGVPWGIALTVGVYWGPCWTCGEPLYVPWAFGSSAIGAVVATVGALFAKLTAATAKRAMRR